MFRAFTKNLLKETMVVNYMPFNRSLLGILTYLLSTFPIYPTSNFLIFPLSKLTRFLTVCLSFVLGCDELVQGEVSVPLQAGLLLPISRRRLQRDGS